MTTTSRTAPVAPSRPGHPLEETAARALRRIGLVIGDGDGDLTRELLPFVIDPESLDTVPPLDSVPEQYDTAHVDIRYRNIPLAPVPVLAPAMAHFLVHGRPDVEAVFLDGHNVYGANLFGRLEGRRLLRRAIGFVHDELTRHQGESDIIGHESDGFLVVRPRAAERPCLRERVEAIISRMTGGAVDDEAGRAIRDRLATFHRHAGGDVLAPATLSHQPRHDLDEVLAESDIGGPGTTDERWERLRARCPSLTGLIGALSGRSPRERAMALTLVEHRIYDPVLHRLAEAASQSGLPVRALGSSGELRAHAEARGSVVYRLEVMSLLKAINEHPHGGFIAGSEALRTVFRWLVTTVQQRAVPPAASDASLVVFRRWGDFYFSLDPRTLGPGAVGAAFAAAAAPWLYVVIERGVGTSGLGASLQATLSTATASSVVVPFMPVVAADVPISDDILEMPVDPPGPAKQRAIAARLGSVATDLDVAFLADWALNACDPHRGITRLMTLLDATPEDIAGLARHYEPYVSRKGKTRFRIRRDAGTVREVADALRRLIVRAGVTP